MSDINITIEGGTSKRLLTAGKYCDRDIVVTAEGGGGASPFAAALIRRGLGYIETGIDGANSNLKIEIRYELLTLPSGYWSMIYAYINETTNSTRITLNKGDSAYVCLNSVPNKSLTSTYKKYENVVYTDIVKPESGTTFSYETNAQKISTTRKSGDALVDKPITLFGRATSDDGVSIKVYYLKIYDGTTLVRDYVPYIAENGECGMYDRVEGKFYGNDGNGAFEAETY